MSEKLSDLVEQWAEICPDECKIRRKTGGLIIVEFADDKVNLAEVERGFDHNNDKVACIVYGAVMRFASRRDLTISTVYLAHSKQWNCEMYSLENLINNEFNFQGENSSFAIAALTAYLKYLRDLKGEGK